MNIERWLSFRYIKSKKRGFSAFLNIISIVGIAIGVASLIVVMGVMTGFGNLTKENIIGAKPHLVISKERGIKDYEAVVQQLVNLPDVVGVSPYVEGMVFLEMNESRALDLIVRGVDPDREGSITKIKEYVVKGSLNDLDSDGIIVGIELARYYGYDIGDELTLIVPGSGIAGKGWRRTLTIRGIFQTRMVDFDSKLVVIDFKQAQTLFNLNEETASAIGVKLRNPYKANDLKQPLFDLLGYSFVLKTWIDENQYFFDALKLEKLGLFIVISMMVLVASFNVASTLMVMVTSKIQDIGILKSTGLTKQSVRRIFTQQGLYIGFLGTAWGVLFGFLISFLLSNYFPVPAKIYTVEHVPVDLQLTDILMIISCSMGICYLASIYPATKAANLEPVSALRYE